MVGGNWAVMDGAIPGLDVADLIRRHSAAARAMQAGCERSGEGSLPRKMRSNNGPARCRPDPDIAVK